MKFMMMVKADKDYEAGVPPSPALMAAIGQITEEMMKAGVVLETGGLLPSAQGARVRLASSKVTVVDGPFTEAKELVGGYAILRANSKEDAIAMGSRFLKVHEEALGPSYSGEIEIRQMAEW
jgi:hypothetical protein